MPEVRTFMDFEGCRSDEVPGVQLEEVERMKADSVERIYKITLGELKAAFKIEGTEISNVNHNNNDLVWITTVELGDKNARD